MTIARSLSHDPEWNLSLERELLEWDEDFLLLYINSPCVVIGRNQSPEAEADLAYCRLHRIPVLRRISGGGAVYHDLGNINYSFITGKGTAPLLDAKPHAPIIAALKTMGVDARTGLRGELTVGGRKISGTAAYVSDRREMFHGTLLFDTDMAHMSKALSGNGSATSNGSSTCNNSSRGRRIASVPAETINLRSLLPPPLTDRHKFLAVLVASLCQILKCSCQNTNNNIV
jgi:lipoate-protein ligase A